MAKAVRKGTRELQELPASTDAFVWLRLYQVEMAGLIPAGRRQPLWWTLRQPLAALSYHGAHRMFERANALPSIVIRDLEGRILYVNPEAEDLYGHSADAHTEIETCRLIASVRARTMPATSLVTPVRKSRNTDTTRSMTSV